MQDNDILATSRLEGRIEGLKEGRDEKAREIARNMLAAGMDYATIERLTGLKPEELLMIDDLKPGYDMARSCGVDFAAVGWANDIPEIEAFMRGNCRYYCKTVEELDAFLAE